MFGAVTFGGAMVAGFVMVTQQFAVQLAAVNATVTPLGPV